MKLRDNYINYFILGILMFHILTGCEKSERLDLYYCPDLDLATKCESECAISKNMKLSSIVNKQEKSVLVIFYESGKQVGSNIYTECTIFDEKNWDCSNDEKSNHMIRKNMKRMVNGVYTGHIKLINLETLKSVSETGNAVCGK